MEKLIQFGLSNTPRIMNKNEKYQQETRTTITCRPCVFRRTCSNFTDNDLENPDGKGTFLNMSANKHKLGNVLE